MNCLWCDEEIMLEVSWTSLVNPTKPKQICESCEKGLVELKGSRCERCSRVSSSTICEDCQWWENYHHGKDVIDFNYSVFSYNHFIQEIIAKWKYRGDYELGFVFREAFADHFHEKFGNMTDVVAVPIPLSKDRLEERCFNQATMLASFLPVPTVEVLSRVHGEKQSKKKRRERISSKNPFILSQKLNKAVLLVDDIYTTGTTLRHAASVLKEAGCPKVYTYTLIRG
ncbi:ComF family protein [Ornithinibacillus californiensis]|uniref:ComF family protein n=1 Tax=Ornithinibacillus californiensis TaxID=161536 RepID=UPI00064DAC58|nr:ComF family protein [Ornithinibacillus californiensis]